MMRRRATWLALPAGGRTIRRRTILVRSLRLDVALLQAAPDAQSDVGRKEVVEGLDAFAVEPGYTFQYYANVRIS